MEPCSVCCLTDSTGLLYAAGGFIFSIGIVLFSIFKSKNEVKNNWAVNSHIIQA